MSYSGAQQAHQARESLGKALEALQQDPNIPAEVLDVAQNIAQAVGSLFQAERTIVESDGKSAIRQALGSLGQTLVLLQDVRHQHNGVGNATETIAGVMSLLFPLTNMPSLVPPAPATFQDPNATVMGAPSPVVQSSPAPAASSQMPVAAPSQAPTHSSAAPVPTPFSGSNSIAYSPTIAESYSAPAASQPAPSQSQPAPAANNSQPSQAPQAHTPFILQNVQPSYVEANIGANTESNFYVGFSGDIGAGGVFVATYESLQKGTPINLLVTLPGGFEFQCQGYVRFVRDPMDFASDSDPGMGIQFNQNVLTPESKQLIQRFIQKRAPIFYDE